MNTLIKTNCPRDCYDACGMVVERRSDGKHRILGDANHPVSRGKLCTKCAIAYNGVWQEEDKRLLYPLKRIGPRDKGSFQQISWDNALSTVADKLEENIKLYGAESILHTHYSGTLSLVGYAFPNRFFNYLGASEVDPDSICNAAGHVAWELLFGNSIFGFDPRTLPDAKSIIVWGANPAHSAPHIHENWLGDFNGKIIVVDPVRTKTATSADVHLQPRPGTDAALAFSLLHCLRAQGKFDADFIAKNTFGYPEILEDIELATPEWGEQKSGVPANTINQVAQIYGNGPSLLWCGQGLQRQLNGGNIMRSVGLLPALTGNIGKAGAGFCYLNISPAVAGIDFDWLKGVNLNKKQKTVISHMELADELTDLEKFKVFFSWNTNPLASAPDQNKLRKNLNRDDLFVVACDIFMTDTAKYADIILPAANFLEYDDLTFSYFNYYIGAQTKISDPLGKSLPNAEIFRRLARKMNITEPSLYESDKELIESMLRQTNMNLSFEDLKRNGYAYIDEKVIIPYSTLDFETPTGKIEIASNEAEKLGLPRTPLPLFEEQGDIDDWRLLSPASFWRMNDSYSNDINLSGRAGEAKVHINPSDAARLRISNGSPLELYNEAGSIELEVFVDDAILPKTLLSYKGRWPSIEKTKKNINFVHKAQKADMAESSSVHSTLVKIRVV